MMKAINLLFWITASLVAQSPYRPEIPKTWDAAALASLEVPHPNPSYSPVAVPVDYYYRVPVRPVYKTYPVYAPGREPAHYLEGLRQPEPEVVFDPAQLHSQQDWIRAGERVFDAPFGFDFVIKAADVQNAAWFEHVRPPITKAGVMPFAAYVIREKGKLELGTFSCAMCHTRVLPDGTVIKGAQGNFPIDRANGFGLRHAPVQIVRFLYRTLSGAPWLNPDPADLANTLTSEELATQLDSAPAGVVVRHRTSMNYPVAIPDLIGLKNRCYFDRTGLVQHRGVGDLMRYAALNNEMDFLSSFGSFIPRGETFRSLPAPSTQLRYSDEQLYALSEYLYALTPPPNPNKPSALTRAGEKLFAGTCAGCHTAPLYTNNKLMPASGFTVPDDHKRKYDVLALNIGTGAGLTLQTRRGTGYYKVPSLQGVWYRGPFEHDGSVATLEDWFNPRRLNAGYVPTGFKGYRMQTRAVKGHEFGLKLSSDDKKALIAFLKTL